MEVQRAKAILKRDLRACVSPIGLLASTGHFNDLWTRDAMFSVRGAMKAGMDKEVKRTLDSLLRAERDGLIPLKIAKGSQLLKLAGFRSTGKYHNVYGNDKGSHAPIDSTMLVLIGLVDYVKETKSKEFLSDWDRIERMVAWVLSKRDSRTGTLVQGAYSDWADSIRRTGSTSYSQVLFIESMRSVAFLANANNKPSQLYNREAVRAQEALEQFWNGRFFVESLTSDRFDASANLLACRFDLVEKKRLPVLLRAIAHHVGSFSLCPRTTDPGHSFFERSFYLNIMGMGAYHESFRWSWIAAVYLQALKSVNAREHKELLNAWVDKIIKDDGVHEVYEDDGRPLHRLFYKSAKPFAWGSAMMLDALS